MYKGILISLLFIGIIFVIVELVRSRNQCPAQKTLYKYIPRTFEEEQNQPVYVSDIFKTMFTQPSPWVGEVNDVDTRKREQINKYFITQM